MRCINHPKRDAVGTCMFCRNMFCDICLERVGEKNLCIDCVEAMAEASVAIREKSFLTLKQMAAGALFILLGLAVAAKGVFALVNILKDLFFSNAPPQSIGGELIGLLGFEAVSVLAYLISGYGLLMSRGWSHWLGLAISAGTLLYAISSLFSLQSRFGFLLLTASGTALILIVLSWREGE
ncbi:MAG: hypothetical protein ABIF01_05290 [Candidatus Micrarchaeota archaeon]